MITIQGIKSMATCMCNMVPTTLSNPEVFYTVTYNSDGLVPFPLPNLVRWFRIANL
jgi:hypothetical protein